MPIFTYHQIKEIAEQLDCGFRAFYHTKTGELIFVPNTDQFNLDTSVWVQEFEKLESNSMLFCEIPAMATKDYFQLMVDFTEQLDNQYFKEELFNALKGNKPFREFKNIIDKSGRYRQDWFDFKNNRYFEWTAHQIRLNDNLLNEKQWP